MICLQTLRGKNSSAHPHGRPERQRGGVLTEDPTVPSPAQARPVLAGSARGGRREPEARLAGLAGRAVPQRPAHTARPARPFGLGPLPPWGGGDAREAVPALTRVLPVQRPLQLLRLFLYREGQGAQFAEEVPRHVHRPRGRERRVRKHGAATAAASGALTRSRSPPPLSNRRLRAPRWRRESSREVPPATLARSTAAILLPAAGLRPAGEGFGTAPSEALLRADARLEAVCAGGRRAVVRRGSPSARRPEPRVGTGLAGQLCPGTALLFAVRSGWLPPWGSELEAFGQRAKRHWNKYRRIFLAFNFFSPLNDGCLFLACVYLLRHDVFNAGPTPEEDSWKAVDWKIQAAESSYHYHEAGDDPKAGN